MSDPLCVCGHRASNHATPDSGDTRCLAVEAREDLLYVFDDGRDGAYGYCGCLRFTATQPDPGPGVAMTQTADIPGGEPTVYLHFDVPYAYARHYTGWTASDLQGRLAEHAAGRGARLMAVITHAGIGWTLARTWKGSRARERQLKRQGVASRRCPICRANRPSRG